MRGKIQLGGPFFFFALLCLTFPATASIVTVVPPDASEGTRIAARDAAAYLGRMAAEPARVEERERFRPEDWPDDRLIVLVQHPDGRAAIDRDKLDAIGKDGFAIGERALSNGRRVIALWGDLPRGAQYAVYALLEMAGVRFFHPEQEHVPATLDLPEKIDALENPAFEFRGYTLHTTHPVELINSFTNCEDDPGYAIRYVDWIVKNRSNYPGGGGRRGWVSEDCADRRGAEIDAYKESRGLLRTCGVGFGSYQQGGKGADFDPETGLPTKENIVRQLESAFADPNRTCDLFGAGFGTTEFTTTDDIAVVELFNTIARWMKKNRPDVPIFINSHTTGSQPTPHYGVEYYDLAQFAPINVGIQVHTMFFYDMIGPAPYYGNQDVRYKLDLMFREAEKGRQLVYYPESAWWLAFDNAIPFYLPIHMKTRDNDIQAIRPLLEKTLRGHKLFTTGAEWGYWQTEWCVGKMQWDPDFRYSDCIDWIAAPLGAASGEAAAVLKELTLDQERRFIHEDLYRYLSGEDEIDEVGAKMGIYTYPMRPPFNEAARWPNERIAAFRKDILDPLREMSVRYWGWLNRLRAVSDRADGRAGWILDEILDGVEADALRIDHIIALYESTFAFREKRPGEAETRLKDAEEITARARTVIARREKGYRYPLEWGTGGGLTWETGKNNGTVYPFRVFTKTHLAYYWTRRNEQVRAVLDGRRETSPVRPLLPLPGEAVKVTLDPRNMALSAVKVDGVSVTDGTAVAFEPKGRTATVSVESQNGPAVQWTAAPVRFLWTLPPEGVKVTRPEGDFLNQGLKAIFPKFLAGPSLDGASLILAEDEDGDGDADSSDFAWFDAAVLENGAWKAGPRDMTFHLTNPSTGKKVSVVRIWDMRLELPDPGSEGTHARMLGSLSTEDVIGAMVDLGDMAEPGARALVANLLHFPVGKLPDRIPFEAELKARKTERNFEEN